MTKYRFCRRCAEAIDSCLTDTGREVIFDAARRGMYVCPWRKPQCGRYIIDVKDVKSHPAPGSA